MFSYPKGDCIGEQAKLSFDLEAKMPTLTDRQGARRTYGDKDLALALLDLAVAEQVNPPTDADLELWNQVVQPQNLDYGWVQEPVPTPGIYYHGTAGDWAGLPSPGKDYGDHDNLWPTALFVSPRYEHSLAIADWKSGRSADSPRDIYVGMVDESRLHRFDSPYGNTHDYGAAVEWTNEQLDVWGDRFGKPGGLIGIEPPAYNSYMEDLGQVLIFDPLDVQWVDVVIERNLSTRGIRQLSVEPGYEEVADLNRKARERADQLLWNAPPVEDLRAHDWRSEEGTPREIVEQTGFPTAFGPEE